MHYAETAYGKPKADGKGWEITMKTKSGIEIQHITEPSLSVRKNQYLSVSDAVLICLRHRNHLSQIHWLSVSDPVIICLRSSNYLTQIQ